MALECDHCGLDITLTTDPPTHIESQYKYCARQFHDSAVATPIIRKRYTVIFHDGIGPSSNEPERPCNTNQAATTVEARSMFREWLKASGNDYTRADGYDQACAEVIETDRWDGISYGDYPWAFLLKRGKRGGIVRENV
jgi:hypothetical protein